MSRLLQIAVISFFVLSTSQFLYSQIKLLSTPAQDFEVLYLSGQQLLNNLNPYQRIGQDVVRNPPPTILAYSLLALLPLLSSQAVWFTISLISFILGSWLLFYILDIKSKTIFLTYLSLAWLFFPLRYNFGSGQVNSVLFLLLILFYYFLNKNKYIWSGWVLALAVTLKITPLFLLLPLILKRQYKAVAWSLVFISVLLFLPYIIIGPSIYQDYSSISQSFFNLSTDVYTNQSLAGFLTRVVGVTNTVKYLYFSILIIYLAFFLKLKNRLVVFNASILSVLIFAPFTWQYHYLIVLIPLVITAYLIGKAKLSINYYCLIIIAYLLMGVNMKNSANFNSLLTSHVLYGSILLLMTNHLIEKRLPR